MDMIPNLSTTSTSLNTSSSSILVVVDDGMTLTPSGHPSSMNALIEEILSTANKNDYYLMFF